MGAAIQTWALEKRYGSHPALRGVDVAVPTGVVFGCLGPNGAGKTTMIRVFAGLLRPSGGRAEVLGLDSVADRDRVQSRIGYLPGEFAAYPDLTAEQYLRYLANLRGGVDWSLVTAMATRFDVEMHRRMRELSHGNRQKVGILQAFMHRPELLILDEPTSGLDPLVQREFLQLVRETREEGRTVFLSSHVLAEVEAVADVVAMLRLGQIVVVESVDALKEQAVHRVDLTFEAPVSPRDLRRVEGVREVEMVGTTAHLAVEGSTADLFETVGPLRVERVVTHEPDLEEIFLAYYDGQG